MFLCTVLCRFYSFRYLILLLPFVIFLSLLQLSYKIISPKIFVALNIWFHKKKIEIRIIIHYIYAYIYINYIYFIIFTAHMQDRKLTKYITRKETKDEYMHRQKTTNEDMQLTKNVKRKLLTFTHNITNDINREATPSLSRDAPLVMFAL